MTTPAPLPVPPPDLADPLDPMLVSFSACVCAELAAIGRPVCGCGCCLVWGDTPPPADFCDCDDGIGQGQAWVRVTSWAPRESTARKDPVSVNRRNNCYPQLLRVVIEAGVYRCVSAGSGNGDPPTCDDRQRDARGLIADARALRRAVSCCDVLRDRATTFGGQWPLGIRGGCSGVYVQFSLDIDRSF